MRATLSAGCVTAKEPKPRATIELPRTGVRSRQNEGNPVQRTAIAAIAVVAILVAAVAGVRWLTHERGGARSIQQQVRDTAPLPSSFDQSLPLEQRIRALEQAVIDERYVRQLLQEELFVLTAEIESLAASRQTEAAANADQSAAFEGMDGAPSAPRRRTGTDARTARLVEAGFDPGQAAWILQRESQLQMEALQARYEAERTGDAMNFFQSRNVASDALRNELGDADYERYLAATGRSTSVAVSTVLDSSPAQRAGLRPGDEITSYDGKRIFSMSDLTRQTMEGLPGEQVVIDVLRDGVSMQVVVPRGPIGISGGRRFSR